MQIALLNNIVDIVLISFVMAHVVSNIKSSEHVSDHVDPIYVLCAQTIHLLYIEHIIHLAS